MENVSSLAAGTLLQGGKYRIVRFIGAGGFGCTYEAVFELLGGRVAIKEFYPHELCNRDATGHISVGASSQTEFVAKMRKKFMDEARALFRFKDLDGVVKVTDIFEENGTSYFVMDYIDGQSLQKLVKERGPLPEAEALRIIREAGQALHRVHERSCLHLDIKPDNIMLTADGHPILIDFGVSKQYSKEEGCNTSTLMGCTPGYAPLEQINSNVRNFLPATDVYALGATLYHLLSGKTPPHVTALFNDDASLEFPPEVSEATRRAVASAMQLKVKDRPASVADFLALLPGAAKKKEPSPSVRHREENERETSTQIVQPVQPSKRSPIWVAVASAAIIVTTIAIFLSKHPSASDGDKITTESTAIVAIDTITTSQTTSPTVGTNFNASTLAEETPSTQSSPAEQTPTQPAYSIDLEVPPTSGSTQQTINTDLNAAIAYLDGHSTWDKNEMGKYPDLENLFEDMNKCDRKLLINEWGPKLKKSKKFQNIVKHCRLYGKKKIRRIPYTRGNNIPLQDYLNNINP